MAKLFPKKSSKDGWHATLTEALALPIPNGQRSSHVMEHGSLSVRLYAPKRIDSQSPHQQDEVYVVASGTGWFVNGSHRHRFSAGDVLFVPAGVQHRFEEFGDNVAIWVIFYGPQGGEAAQG